MICKAFTGYSINGVAMAVTNWLQENDKLYFRAKTNKRSTAQKRRRMDVKINYE